MCQLAAYVGAREKSPLLLRSLELQEPYFGGHATGLAVVHEGNIYLEKDQGHVTHVRDGTKIMELDGSVAIAHSRYNGNARTDPRYNTREMAHPFISGEGDLALMHNGGISNYEEHWAQLRDRYAFKSYSEKIDGITDSEVAIHMLSDLVGEGQDIEESLKGIAARFTGSFLLAVISRRHPDKIWIANWHQPCFIGFGEDEAMFCSSLIGFHEIEDELDVIFQPQKNSLITLTRDGVDIEPLDILRTIPDLSLDKIKLRELIISILEEGEADFRGVWYALHPYGWAEAYGVTSEKWMEHRKAGVGIVNPFIEVLDELIIRDEIERWTDLRLEGGVRYTPRYSYRLK
jgi:glucosamine--fructose-6-phosphate aminotransferase (isomerizing)